MAAVPRLSLCMIARNEAANIVRCLRSLQGVAAEMIVVDTGSTDDTSALAAACGAQVFHIPWCDDFAAARNAALDRATGDWILWLDADEWLLAESVTPLYEAIAQPDALAWWLLRQDVEFEGQTGGFVEMLQLRLWRNDPALRMIGVCHPHFGTALERRCAETERTVLNSRIRIRHTGYLPHLKRAKLERGARLLQKELALRPGQLYYQVELAWTWCLLNDPRGPSLLAQVTDRLLAMADAPYPPTVEAQMPLEVCIRQGELHSERVQVAIRLAARWFPDSPPLLHASAEAHYKAGDFEGALQPLQRMIKLAANDTYDRRAAFDSHLIGVTPLLNLAVCYHRLARLEEAEHWYRLLLARYPDHMGARQNLAALEQQRRS